MTIYVVHTRVVKIEEKFITHSVRKDPQDSNNTIVHRDSIGWFILFEGSSEYLHLGTEKPELEIGNAVEIMIRKR